MKLNASDIKRRDWLRKHGEIVYVDRPGSEPGWAVNDGDPFSTAREAIDAAMVASGDKPARKPHSGHTTHGMSKDKMYSIWHSMIQRCYNPNHIGYKYYGASGVTVCDRWRNSLQAFCSDIGTIPNGLQMDREDNSKGYSPENVKLKTCRENSFNKRNSRWWILNGVKYQSALAAAEALGTTKDKVRRACGMIRSRGVTFQALPGCWSELKYPKRSLNDREGQ